MARKYNYFDDDDPIVQGKIEKSKAKNMLAFFKYVFVVALFTIKDFVKNLTSARGRQKIRATATEIKEKAPVGNGFRLGIAFFLIIALVISSFVISINKETKRQHKFNEAAYKVCSDYYNEYGISNYKSLAEYGIKGYMVTGLSYVRELDFDDDSTSELLIIYNDNDIYFAEVWGFDSGEFKQLYSNQITYSTNLNDDVWLAIYNDGRKYCIAEHNLQDITDVTILKLSGDKFTKKKKASYDPVTLGYSIRNHDETADFEQIKMSVIKEYNAAAITEQVYDTVDSFTTTKKTNNAPLTKKPEGIKGAYWGIIERYNEQYGSASVKSENGYAYIDGLADVELIDFDGDKTNELVLVYRKTLLTRGEDKRGNMITYQEPEYFCEIYKWQGETASMIYQSEGISNMLNSTDTKYLVTKKEDGKALLCKNSFVVENYGRRVNATSRIMELEEDNFTPKMKAEYQTQYGYTEYYLDGRYTYKSTFESKGGFEVPYFNGHDDEYDESVWTVSFVQMPGSDKGKLEDQVKATVKAIQEINPSYHPTNAVE